MVALAKAQKAIADKQHVRIKRTEASPRYKVQIFYSQNKYPSCI
jgi:hypothetical protein